MDMCTGVTVCTWSSKQVSGVGSVHHVGPGDGTEVVRLGSSHLSHSASSLACRRLQTFPKSNAQAVPRDETAGFLSHAFVSAQHTLAARSYSEQLGLLGGPASVIPADCVSQQEAGSRSAKTPQLPHPSSLFPLHRLEGIIHEGWGDDPANMKPSDQSPVLT